MSFEEGERGVIEVNYVHNVIIVPDVLDVSLVLNVLDVFKDIPKFGFSFPL